MTREELANLNQEQLKQLAERQGLWRKALEAAITEKTGRDLNQRFEAGLGVWWPELGPLTPGERTLVIAEVKRILGLAKLVETRDERTSRQRVEKGLPFFNKLH